MDEAAGHSPITMRDVAREAGVNLSSVSRALRNDPQVSIATRTRIQKLAKKMGYRPNPLVQALAAQVRGNRRGPRPATIALLDCRPSEGGGELQGYRAGAMHRATDMGYSIEEISLREFEGPVSRINSVLRTHGIRGLVVLPQEGTTSLAELRLDQLATVTIGHTLNPPGVNRAAPHCLRNMQIALAGLQSSGRRRIGLCMRAAEQSSPGHDWYGGYAAWQTTLPGKDRIPAHVSRYAMRPESGSAGPEPEEQEQYRKCQARFEQWLVRHNPDAIITDDLLFYHWTAETGRHIPADISVSALSLDPKWKRLSPVPSGIDERHEQIGMAAIDLVLGHFYRNDYGRPRPEKSVLIEGQWIEGQPSSAS